MDTTEYRLRPIAAIMYLQDAFARYCALKRMAAYDLFAINQYWVVAGFNISFIGNMPFWSEEIEVEIWISEITKLKIYTDYRIYSHGKIFAEGDAVWFILDKRSKKPVTTDTVLQRFEICEEFVLGRHTKFSPVPAAGKIAEIIHTNNLSDIDFNNHVNNKSYINIAEMTMSENFKAENRIKKLHIKFNKETFLQDTLTCCTYKTEIANTFTHIIKKDDISVCDISTVWERKIKTESIVNCDLDVKKEKIQ